MKNTDIEYVIQKGDKEVTVLARTPAEALGIFLKRGRYGLGAGWRFMRSHTGWIIATKKDEKHMERAQWKLREANYKRNIR